MIKYLCASFIVLSASLLAMDPPKPEKQMNKNSELAESNKQKKKKPSELDEEIKNDCELANSSKRKKNLSDSPRKPRKETRAQSDVAPKEPRSRSNSAVPKESRSRSNSAARKESCSPKDSWRHRFAEGMPSPGRVIVNVFSGQFFEPCVPKLKKDELIAKSELKIRRVDDDLVIEAISVHGFIFYSLVPKNITTEDAQKIQWQVKPQSQSMYGFNSDGQATVRHIYFNYFTLSPSTEKVIKEKIEKGYYKEYQKYQTENHG